MHHSMLLSLLDDISETMNLTKKRCQIIPSSLAECCKVSKNGSHELLVVTTQLFWFFQLSLRFDVRCMVRQRNASDA